MKIEFIRHGMTEGNKNKKYIGRTDEALCPEGREMLENIRKEGEDIPDLVFSSPLKRCRETGEILFPGKQLIIIEEFSEMDFGLFENRAFKEDLEHDPQYQKWLDSMCEGPVPGGESKEDFTKRCCRGFQKAMELAGDESAEDLAFVVHGGTIMSILSKYGKPEREYYEWHCENGHGFCGIWEDGAVKITEEI